MKTLLGFSIILLVFTSEVFSQNAILWDGEVPDPATCNKAYGTILPGPDAHGGTYCFRAEPDNAHSPRIGFNCSGMWRADISRFDELRFFIKCNVADQSTSVRFTTYFAKSPWVSLAGFIQGGNVTTDYREVRIPLSLFKSADYNLSSIEYLEIGTSPVAQLQFFIDDIEVADNNPPQLKAQLISDQVIKIEVSERFDTIGCDNSLNYTISSTSDPDYQTPLFPSKIGRHAYVKSLSPGSGSPNVAFELFLIFDKPLKSGSTYQLIADGLKDPSGNGAKLDTTFQFSDLEIYGNIKINQAGYLPASPKLGKLGNFLGDAWFMPINEASPTEFQLINNQNETVFTGQTAFLKADSAFSGEKVFELDFSAYSTPGEYHIYVPGYGRSEGFTIADDVYNPAYFQTARALFYQRSGKLEAAQGGKWARDGLPATTAEIHSSQTASPLHSDTDYPDGTKIPMSKGWLDAGDYGRYVPTAASALFILFTAYELYPQKFPDKHLNIPESGNKIPDILDELKYETDWLKQMQAPDGGVYFRVTPATWSAGLPGEENNTLFVSEKTTQSTAMFAAAMAMAYRNFKKYWPTYADSCLDRSKKAWVFLQAHTIASAPVSMPGVSAGPYPDPEDRDNRAWAAAELYKSTGDAAYNQDFLNWYGQIPHEFHATMSWQQHTVKAAWAYATTTFPTDPALVNQFKSNLITDILVNYNNRTMLTHAYHGAYHPFKGYIGYGTFAMAQSYAFDYIMFSFLFDQPELLEYAKIQLDIPLGNNPMSRSFITGIGKNPPKSPLHWSTVVGKYDEPVPGVPVFGPTASLLMNRPSSFVIQDSANRYPYGYTKEDPYPVLRRYTDAREAVEMSEFTVQEIAVTAAVFAFFSSIVTDPLPVKLVRFIATSDQCKVNLSWTTSEEVNADYFSIERSGDGILFTEIGRQNAAGTTNISQVYSFPDQQPGNRNYYRLRAVDFDGTYELSRIIFMKTTCDQYKVVVRQTARNFYDLAISAKDLNPIEKLTAELYDIQGIRKKQYPANPNTVTPLDGSGMTPGVYILKIQDHRNQVIFTDKLVIY